MHWHGSPTRIPPPPVRRHFYSQLHHSFYPFEKCFMVFFAALKLNANIAVLDKYLTMLILIVCIVAIRCNHGNFCLLWLHMRLYTSMTEFHSKWAISWFLVLWILSHFTGRFIETIDGTEPLLKVWYTIFTGTMSH